MSTYLDYNASSPVHPEVLQVMMSAFQDHYGNADSRTHIQGIAANELVSRSRSKVARLFAVDTSEVVLTSGATESINLAILGMASYGKQTDKKHIITTAMEHKAILMPLQHLEKSGFTVDYVASDESGRVEASDVITRIRPDTLMVCMMHANNETGVIQPVHEIGEKLKNSESYFLVDAAQTCGKLVDELQSCHYDFLSASAHKFHGPQGVGALIVRKRNYRRPPIQPIIFGGGQEHGLRPGTLPVALIAGMGHAAEIAQNHYSSWTHTVKATKSFLLDLISNSSVEYSINGTQQYCMPNTLNISFSNVDSEALMLAVKGICSFSNGSACSAHEYAPSHVLQAMSLPQDRIECAVRLSWDVEDVRNSLRELISIVDSLQH